MLGDLDRALASAASLSVLPRPDELRGALARELLPSSQDRPRRRVGFTGVELWQLPKAGEFSSDEALQNPVELIKEFRRQPASQLLRALIEGSDDDLSTFSWRKPGRPRMQGDWPALFLAYVATGAVAVEKFRNAIANKNTGLLEACGFGDVPSRQAVDLRFAELEDYSEAFTEVARELISHARQIDPQIGVSVFVDGTACHSASTLEHRCENEAACQQGGGDRVAQLRRATPSEVTDDHHRESEAEGPRLDAGAAAGGRTRGSIITLPGAKGPISYRCFSIRGHRYLTRDLSSGVRWYDKSRGFWLGGYLQAAVDMYTGLPLAISVFPADVAEWDGYPDLFRGMVAALGEAPRVVSVDRGFALRPFHEFNTRRGVAVVAPFRKRTQGEELVDRRTDAFDEHGVPRCKFCGGPADQTSRGFGLAFDSAGEPYIRCRCLLGLTHDCQKPQSIRCAEDWVQLLPLSRETGLYHAVRHAHHNKEGLFQHDRRRYAVAGKEGLGRLCRSGIEAHRLRASAALLLNWFRISLRQGWLDPVELPVSRNTSEPVRLSGLTDIDSGELLEQGVGAAALRKLELHRDEHRLELPYGRAAARLRRAYQEIG